MSAYEIYNLLHVGAVIAWVGAGIGISVLSHDSSPQATKLGLMSVGRQMEGMGKRFFSPMAATTLVTGMLMVVTTDGLSFGDTWIVIGLAGVAVSMALGMAAIKPTGRKMVEESEKQPPDPGIMAGYASRLRVLSLTNLVILTFVVWAMVTKPGL